MNTNVRAKVKIQNINVDDEEEYYKNVVQNNKNKPVEYENWNWERIMVKNSLPRAC